MQPYVAPVLLLPVLFLCTAYCIIFLVIASKWVLTGKAKRSSYLKYSVEFMRKIIASTIMVSPQLLLDWLDHPSFPASLGVALPHFPTNERLPAQMVASQFALLEMARGSYWHCAFLRAMGSHVEREVFFDTTSFLVWGPV